MNLNYRMMQVLARLFEMDEEKRQPTLLHILPCLRILGTVFCILFCSLSSNAVFPLTIAAILLVRLAFFQQDGLVRVVRKCTAAALFTMVLMLPEAIVHQSSTMLTVTLKVAESVLVLAELNEEISWKEMTDAFRFFHIPDLFILVLDLTVRFLIILGRYSNALSEAVRLRSVGKKSWKDSHIGGILGTTYLKSQQMASATSEAMACRLFDGTYRRYQKQHFTFQDGIYLVLLGVLVLFFFYTERVL